MTSDFGRKVYQKRLEKGWSQSDLARKIWGVTTDSRGHEVARNRDRVSQWESGKSLPSSDNLMALANALGMAPEALAPKGVGAERIQAKLGLLAGGSGMDGADWANGDAPGLVQLLSAPDGRARLRIDMVLPMKLALHLAGLVTRSVEGGFDGEGLGEFAG